MAWGERSARIQQVGNDMTAGLWWLVGEQEFLNLEFWHHSEPAQRPLPADWAPNAVGWVRWGFAVADFDAALACLKSAPTKLSEVVAVSGLRRVCFRDPDIGVAVELMEEGAALSRTEACVAPSAAPRLVYVTLSVSDLAAARAFYADAMEMPPVSAPLHSPDMEGLWGLPGAKRDVSARRRQHVSRWCSTLIRGASGAPTCV